MTQRKRATHYALLDAAFAADRKFIRLAAKATPPIEYAAAVGVFFLLLADCRRAKSPEIDWSEYEEYQPQVELLQSVGLLTDTGFPPGPFDKWAPAYKSPYDERRGTKGNTEVRNGTHGNPVSVQFSSIPGVGGAGGEGRELTEAERDALLQENLRLMNDPKAEPHVRRAAEKTVARLREGRKSA